MKKIKKITLLSFLIVYHFNAQTKDAEKI